MSVWVRDPQRRRLVRVEPKSEPELEPESEEKPKPVLKMKQERSLNGIVYPSRTTLPSCFSLPDLRPKVTFELRPHYTQMLPKFTGLEDAYLFLREF